MTEKLELHGLLWLRTDDCLHNMMHIIYALKYILKSFNSTQEYTKSTAKKSTARSEGHVCAQIRP
jgi:hypothetical protein